MKLGWATTLALLVITQHAWSQPSLSASRGADVRATVRAALSVRPPLVTELATLPTLPARHSENAYGVNAAKSKAAENASTSARANGRGVGLGVAKKAASGETRIPPGQAKKLGIPQEKPGKRGKP